MHPVAGVYGCIFALLYAIENNQSVSVIFIFFFVCVFYIAVLYLPVVFIDVDSWKLNFIQRGFIERTHSLIDISVFLKYVSLNPLIIFLALMCILNAESIFKEITFWLIIYFTIAYFHQSYYFHYLFSFALWRLSRVSSFRVPVLFKIGFIIIVLYSMSITYFLRIFQIAENYNYAKTFKQILHYLENSEDETESKKVWVPGEIAMPILAKSNTRLHWSFIANYKGTMQPIDSTSIFYLDDLHQLDYIKQYSFVKNTNLKVQEIIAPVKGLLTISREGKRSDSLGLWEVKVLPGN